MLQLHVTTQLSYLIIGCYPPSILRLSTRHIIVYTTNQQFRSYFIAPIYSHIHIVVDKNNNLVRPKNGRSKTNKVTYVSMSRER